MLAFMRETGRLWKSCLSTKRYRYISNPVCKVHAFMIIIPILKIQTSVLICTLNFEL